MIGYIMDKNPNERDVNTIVGLDTQDTINLLFTPGNKYYRLSGSSALDLAEKLLAMVKLLQDKESYEVVKLREQFEQDLHNRSSLQE